MSLLRQSSFALLLLIGSMCLGATDGQAVAVDICKGPLEPSVPGDCQGIESVGCCDPLGRALYCGAGGLYCIDCAGTAPYCGWWPNPGYYDCNVKEAGASDPSETYPMACGGCADCASDAPCSPDCPGGCGSCGNEGDICLDSGLCHTPECVGKECGTDSAGVVCGHCTSGSQCDPFSGKCFPLPEPCVASSAPGCSGCDCESCVCEKYPNCCTHGWDTFCTAACELECGFDCSPCPEDPGCDDKECGTYCGLDCGGCTAGDVCYGFTCCTPACAGRACGADGCGGICGECDGLIEQCEPLSGQCVDKVPGCESTSSPGCGDCPCEACVCEERPECCSETWDATCADLCVQACGGCDPCAVSPSCEGKSCGAWCGNDCGSCAGEQVCFDFQCCSPDCEGKTCGDNGCGGLCGICGSEELCKEGLCVSVGCETSTEPGCGGCGCEACVCAEDPFCCDAVWDATCASRCASCGELCGELPVNPCDEHPGVGCCHGNSRRFCEDGHLKEQVCDEEAPCGWNEGADLFTCGTDGTSHPGLKFTKGCDTCPEQCAIPKCSLQCYGQCGVCPEGSACRDDGICVPAGTGCADGLIYEGMCVGESTVSYCKEDTAEVITLQCAEGEHCDWDPVQEQYGCRDTPVGSCTDACEIGDLGCSANGVWAYTCQLDLATNCKVRAFEKCALGAVCIDGECPKQVPCEDECVPGDGGCFEWDKWQCQQDVDGCWFKAQITCVFGCEDGECLLDPGPCGKTQFNGFCDDISNYAQWCEDGALIVDECGSHRRCIYESVSNLSRCMEASFGVPCLTEACALP